MSSHQAYCGCRNRKASKYKLERASLFQGHELLQLYVDVPIGRLDALAVPNWSRISRHKRPGHILRSVGFGFYYLVICFMFKRERFSVHY